MFGIPALFMFFSSGTDEAKLQQELHTSSLPKQSRANRSQIAHVWDSGGRTAGNPELVDRLLRGGRGSSQRIQVGTAAAAPSDASPDAGPAAAAARKAQLEARIEEIKSIDDYDEKPDLLTELKACRRSLRDLKNNETIAAHNQRRAEAALKKQKKKKKKKQKKKLVTDAGANPIRGDSTPNTSATSPPQQEV